MSKLRNDDGLKFLFSILAAAGLSSCTKKKVPQATLATGAASTQMVSQLWMTSPSTAAAGDCVPIAVQALDAAKKPTTFGTVTALSLLSGTTSGGSYVDYFFDPQCRRSVGDILTVAPGDASAALYVRARASDAANVTVSATSDPTVAASATIAITRGPARQVQVDGSPVVVAGECGTIGLATADIVGNLRAPDGDIALDVSAAPAVRFFSDDQCAVETTSFTLAAGRGTMPIYVQAPSYGTVDIRLQPRAPLWIASSNPAYFLPSREFTAVGLDGPKAVSVGTCTAYAVVAPGHAPFDIAVVLGVRSANGEPGAIFSDAECKTAVSATTFTAGAVAARFYFKASATGQFVIQLSDPIGTANGSATEVVDAL